jgi:hypothetical protein
MGMSSYVMDVEEQFIDKCASIAIDSESFEEYAKRTIKAFSMVPHLSGQEISDIIEDVWYEMTVQLGGN